MANYKFPDELDGDDGEDFAVTPVGEEVQIPARGNKREAAAEVEVEIEDDTPPADRGRRPMATPPKELSDDELSQYDEKVQNRLRHFTRGYHEERRAKEEALRERQAAEEFAKQVYEENKRLQQQLATGSEQYVEQAKSVAEIELEAAKKKYKEAYEAGDPDLLTDAQAEISRATLKLDKAQNMRPLQVQEKEVQVPQSSTPANNLSERDKKWLDKNTWFGPDDEMTSTALGLHRKLLKQHGADFVGSREYYETVDATMRRRYPDYFGSDEDEATSRTASNPDYEDEPPRRAQKSATVVAPATRSTPPNRMKLKASQASIARKLGVPYEEYAKQVALLKQGE
jgi:hypothetical protein